MKRNLVIIAATATIGIGIWLLFGRSHEPTVSASNQGAQIPLVEVVLPETLSDAALAGEGAFVANCASCHGMNAAGNDGMGPPLVHKIYEPSHHGDIAFELAVAQGVRQHHWTFGNMQPRPEVSPEMVAEIIAYVRELQRANGIN